MSDIFEARWMEGERVLDVAPRFTPRVGEPFPRRLNHVPGRTLTADALGTEQRQRSQRLQFLARVVEPGILAGLEAQAVEAPGGGPAVSVAAGTGLTAAGEEVVLHRPLIARLADIPPAEPLIEADLEPTGLVVLSLKPVRAVSAFQADDEDPCPTDVTAYPYADIVTVDAARLVWSRIGAADSLAELLPRADDAPPGMAGQMVQPPTRFGDDSAPPPRPLAVHRNVVARRIIESEAAAANRGSPPPWSRHGVPLALAEITGDGQLVFLDRFAVARSGGAVKAPRPVGTALPRPLARARFEQFIDLLQALRREGADLSAATRYFRYLPPVGILPATLVDFAPLAESKPIRASFFPSGFRIEAAPIPLEQLESALALRAGLANYDLARPDYIQLIVPVPEHLYEPRLLLTEKIAPDFDAAIADAEADIVIRGTMLADLNGMEHSVVGLIDRAEIVPTPPVPEGGRVAPARFDDRARALVEKLAARTAKLPALPATAGSLSVADFDAMVANPTLPEPVVDAAPVFLGLKPTLTDLTTRLDKANDVIDMSFVRVQAEIYRARKHLAGEEDMSRLVTSPVLANLAVSTTGVQTSALIQNLFKTERLAPQPQTALQLPTTGTQPVPGRVDSPVVGPAITSFLADRRSFEISAAATGSLAGTLLQGASANAITLGAVSVPSLFGAVPTIDLRGATAAADLGATLATGFAAERIDLSQVRVSTASVALQGLLYGKSSPIRTVTVAERLRPSPAQEAKNGAVATKAEVVRMLQDLALDLSGLLLPITANRTALVDAKAFDAMLAKLEGQDRTAEALVVLRNPDAVRRTEGYALISDRHILASAAILVPNSTTVRQALSDILRDLYAQRLDLGVEDLPGLILGDLLDPDPADPDEAAYYAAAVDALESTVSILRLAEGRVHGYQSLLETLRDALLGAYALAEEWRGAVEAEQAALAEAEHDRAVAQALKSEELARLDGINTRRRDILDKHVDIVAFARPRGIDRFSDAPGIDLFGPFVDPIPAVLERGHEPPRELEEMVDALREAPIGWFPALRAEIDRIDQANRLKDAFARGRLRATDWLVRNDARAADQARILAQSRLSGLASSGVQIALNALNGRMARSLQIRASLPLDLLAPLGWKALRDRALAELSIEDLAGAGKAGAALARAGLAELDRIGSVAAGFLEVLREVPAAIRLGWAETLSVHDEAPDLGDISVAPRWTEIALPERRELEHLHRWLFGRVDLANPEARAAMSEIVRVCLLLASHAPVSALVEGRPERNDTVAAGEVFQVAVGRGTPSIGMAVAFGAAAAPARGVIEDIVGERVLVRVTGAPAGPVALTPQTELRFARQVEGQLVGTRR